MSLSPSPYILALHDCAKQKCQPRAQTRRPDTAATEGDVADERLAPNAKVQVASFQAFLPEVRVPNSDTIHPVATSVMASTIGMDISGRLSCPVP